MSDRLYYLDSSALVKLVRQEAESGALEAFLGESRLVSSTLARVELGRAARRAAGEDREVLRAQEVLACLYLVPPTDAVLDLASRLGPPSLRSLDAIHLATAMTILPDLTAFVAYDGRLLAAAAAQGLPVASPG